MLGLMGNRTWASVVLLRTWRDGGLLYRSHRCMRFAESLAAGLEGSEPVGGRSHEWSKTRAL